MPHIKKQWLLLGLAVLLLLGYWQTRYTHYTRLEALLAAHEWKSADRLTTQIILRESNWGVSTWKMWGVALLTGKLTGWYEPIKQYPCDDLQTLDSLWLKYSDGQFGLSVQRQMFERIAAQFKDEFKTFDAFMNEVEWDRPTSSNIAIGHFPSEAWV